MFHLTEDDKRQNKLCTNCIKADTVNIFKNSIDKYNILGRPHIDYILG